MSLRLILKFEQKYKHLDGYIEYAHLLLCQLNIVLYRYSSIYCILSKKCKEVIVMGELFVEKVINAIEDFLDNN